MVNYVTFSVKWIRPWKFWVFCWDFKLILGMYRFYILWYTADMGQTQDIEFILKLKGRIENSVGKAVNLDVDYEEERSISLDLDVEIPRVVFGCDILKYPGLARMFTKYTILSIKEGRLVSQDEFLRFLGRN